MKIPSLTSAKADSEQQKSLTDGSSEPGQTSQSAQLDQERGLIYQERGLIYLVLST